MGGMGSGRRAFSTLSKSTTEDYRDIDVRWLKRQNGLKPGYSGQITWRHRGEITGQIGYRVTLLRDITPGAIRQSAIELYPDVGPATRNRQVITVTKAIINHAAEMGWCNPIKVKKFEEPDTVREYVTPQWAAAFASQATDDGLPHLAALCLFMLGTGARLGEATSLTWDDVDLHVKTAHIRQTKTSSERTAHLQESVWIAIANIPSNRKPDDKVFQYAGSQSVHQVWRNIIARAGLEPRSPHGCRHGFATLMLRAGHDVKTVAKLGGWKDAGIVLKHYAHANEDRTVTDAIFGTNLAHGTKAKPVTIRGKKGNSS